MVYAVVVVVINIINIDKHQIHFFIQMREIIFKHQHQIHHQVHIQHQIQIHLQHYRIQIIIQINFEVLIHHQHRPLAAAGGGGGGVSAFLKEIPSRKLNMYINPREIPPLPPAATLKRTSLMSSMKTNLDADDL